MTDPDNGAIPPVPPPAPPVASPAAPAAGGYASPPPAYAAATGPAPSKTLSLIGMIAGIVGVVAFGWFIPASIAAIILGTLGKKREGLPAKGFWLTALITGWVGVGLSVLVVGGTILIVVLTAAAGYRNY